MKTPGKKKDASRRTRAATAAVAKLKAVSSAIFDVRDYVILLILTNMGHQESDGDKENPIVVSDFHQALIDVKSSEATKAAQIRLESLSTDKKQIPKTVIVMDSPAVTNMELDEAQLVNAKADDPQEQPPPVSEETPIISHEETSSKAEIKYQPDPSQPSPARALSPVLEGSGLSKKPLHLPAPNPESAEIVQSEVVPELSMIAEDEEPNEQSAIPEGPSQPPSLPSEEITDPMDQDIAVPLRDNSSSGTLKRKQSMTQFSGLPAPSPIRKSMRMSREPSGGAGLLGSTLAQTPGAGLTGKRTSWLVKAKEAKALEMTGSGKRRGITPESSTSNHATLGLGLPSSLTQANSKLTSRDTSDTAPKVATAAKTPAPKNDIVMAIDQPEEKKASPLWDDDITGRINSQSHFGTWPRTLPPEVHSTHDTALDDMTVPLNEEDSESGVLDRLKRTLEGAGTRSYRSLGKSLGGNAAAALAEARAAAEARVAQRNKETGADVSVVEVESSIPAEAHITNKPFEQSHVDADLPPSSHQRLSLSELVSSSTKKNAEQTSSSNVAQINQEADASISTTPPNSPPSSIAQKPSVAMPIFTPVPPLPPAAAASKGSTETKHLPSTSSLHNFQFKLPSSNPFSLPDPAAIQAALPPPPTVKPLFALAAETNKASVFSDTIFEKPENARNTALDIGHPIVAEQMPEDDLDDDDSWHMDEKFRANETWTPYGFVNNDKSDNTWSTLPSQHDDTGPLPPSHGFAEALKKATQESTENYTIHREDDNDAPGAFDFDPNMGRAQLDINDAEMSMDMDLDDDANDVDLDEFIGAGKPTITLVTVRSIRFIQHSKY
jgi:hypothetical protein